MSTRLLIPRCCQLVMAYAVAIVLLLACFNNPARAVAAEARVSEKPNILLIVADDLGYADVGFHGGKEIPTPHIDSVAAGGVQFTNGYVTCPVCSPTRAGILTGRYQQRFGHEFNPGGVNQKNSEELGLPLSETTIADALRDAGYRTAVIGKWHLGGDRKRHPLRRGFDHFYGFLGGAHPYVPTGKGGQGGGPIYRDDTQIDAPAHLTSEFGKKAAEYVSEKNDKPFFLYLTFNAVHNPLQPDEEHLARFAKIQDPQRRSYAALLSGLDDAIGSVLTALKESGKLEDTLVFFVSDNGGPQDKNGSDNTPLSGDKGTVLEGGVRVPFVVQWQGHLPVGKKVDAPVNSLDISATAAAAAGAKFGSDEKKIDGIDLIPYITGEAQGDPHESLFWRFGTQRAIRQGDYKLRQQGDEPPQLFNLVNDIGETKDLSSERPELVKKLDAAYAEWNSELAEPLWKAGKSSGKNSARASRRGAGKNAGERRRKQSTIVN
jgi:arylsulfatase A-like enzyme